MATTNKSPEYHYYFAGVVSYDGPIRCDNCPLLQTYSRKKCELTAEYIGDSRRIGYICPLIPVSADEFFRIKNLVNEENENVREYEFEPL